MTDRVQLEKDLHIQVIPRGSRSVILPNKSDGKPDYQNAERMSLLSFEVQVKGVGVHTASSHELARRYVDGYLDGYLRCRTTYTQSKGQTNATQPSYYKIVPVS